MAAHRAPEPPSPPRASTADGDDAFRVSDPPPTPPVPDLIPSLSPRPADAARLPPTPPPMATGAAAASTTLHFRVRRDTGFGNCLSVLGSHPQLGAWDTRRALHLTWTPGDFWIGSTAIDIPALPAVLEYRYFVAPTEAPLDDPDLEASFTALQLRGFDVEPNPARHQDLDRDQSSQSSARKFIWETGTAHRVEFGSTLPRTVKMQDKWGVAEPNRQAGFGSLMNTHNSSTMLEKNRDTELPVENIDGTARVRFRITNPPTEYGDNVHVCGALEELGAWHKEKSPALSFHHNAEKENVWQLEITIPLSYVRFEYKYFVWRASKERQWEDGFDSNRIAMPFVQKVCPDTGVILFDDVWEKNKIKFSIFFPIKDTQHLSVTGDPDAIGAWFRPGPTTMRLGAEGRLETDVVGRKWELEVAMPTSLKLFDYRYIIVDEVTGATVWEREPNRRADFYDKEAINSQYDLKDVNFVGGMDFDFCPPNLFIGPYPQSTDDIDKLKAAGVGAVLNVQTDEDFVHRQINWRLLADHYAHVGIQVTRFPITDFDRESLQVRLMGAVAVIDEYAKQGLHVFIHCTAGMGRAPAAAVAYLVWVCGWQLDDALVHVKKHRTVAVPNVPVLQATLKNPYRP